MYRLEHQYPCQEDYTVEAAPSLNSRNSRNSQHDWLSITAMLPDEGRITGNCHA